MPRFGASRVRYKPPKDTQEQWDTFRGGLNKLFPAQEIQSNELAQMDNLLLVGGGIPTKRLGTNLYFSTYSTGTVAGYMVRGLKAAKFASGPSGQLQLLALNDSGYLVQMNNASYSILPGYSYASGYDAYMVQLNNIVYIANTTNTFTKYNGVSIYSFTSVGLPASLTASLWSGATGTNTYNWLVSAANDIGETLATALASLANLPLNCVSAYVNIAWSPASPTSIITKYNIYGRSIGFATFLDSVDVNSNSYLDTGVKLPSLIAQPPTANTTGGPIFKILATHKDKLIGADANFPSRLWWSGGGPYTDKFNWSVGGGWVDISPSDGDEITGIIDAFKAIIVFKRRSIWRVVLSVVGPVVVPIIDLVTRAVGCSSPKTIKYVENDIFFLSDRGVFAIGYHPNINDVLQTNEISVKIRPIFQGVNTAQIGQCSAVYFDNKYRVFYPNGGAILNNQEVWYDRERLAWLGPMSYQEAGNVHEIFKDGANKLHLLWGNASNALVTEYSSSYGTDYGAIISTIFLSKKEVFGDPFLFKFIRDVFTGWRSIVGTANVTVLIEDRTGTVSTASSFTITPSQFGVGWGFDKWGTFKWGTSAGAGSSASSTDIEKWLKLIKTARSIQLQITTTGVSDSYQLLAVKFRFHILGRGYTPQGWRVN